MWAASVELQRVDGRRPRGVVHAHLRRHRTAQRQAHLAAGVGWAEDDFVFTYRRGAPLEPSNVTGKWQASTETADLARVRFHALRHVATTVLLAAGVPLAVIELTRLPARA